MLSFDNPNFDTFRQIVFFLSFIGFMWYSNRFVSEQYESGFTKKTFWYLIKTILCLVIFLRVIYCVKYVPLN